MQNDFMMHDKLKKKDRTDYWATNPKAMKMKPHFSDSPTHHFKMLYGQM